MEYENYYDKREKRELHEEATHGRHRRDIDHFGPPGKRIVFCE